MLILVQLWVIAGLAWFASIIKIIAAQMSRQVKSIKKKVEVSSPAMLNSKFCISQLAAVNKQLKCRLLESGYGRLASGFDACCLALATHLLVY